MTRPSWPYLPQFLPRLQHIFLPHPRGKCLSTDCPVVIIDMCQLCFFTGNVFSPIIQSSLMMRWHVSVMCLHWECLFTDCPFVNDDSLTCQSCIHIGSVCSLIVQSPLIIHWHVSVLCVHWEWQVHRLSSRQLWFSDVSQSCVYIGNGKFTDCPVVIYDLVTWVSHVSTLGMSVHRLSSGHL